MSTTATVTNGKPQRKQLSDQLDRLDGIIDALADGLNQAVADAAREGAREAVRAALVEVMTSPELRAVFTPVPPVPLPPSEAVPEPKKPGLWSRLKAKFAAARDAVTGAAQQTREAVAAQCKAAGDAVAAVGKATGEAWPWKRVLWVSAGVGLTVGVISLAMPHAAAAAVGAVSAAATSVAVQTGTWLKKAAGRLGLV